MSSIHHNRCPGRSQHPLPVQTRQCLDTSPLQHGSARHECLPPSNYLVQAEHPALGPQSALGHCQRPAGSTRSAPASGLRPKSLLELPLPALSPCGLHDIEHNPGVCVNKMTSQRAYKHTHTPSANASRPALTKHIWRHPQLQCERSFPRPHTANTNPRTAAWTSLNAVMWFFSCGSQASVREQIAKHQAAWLQRDCCPPLASHLPAPPSGSPHPCRAAAYATAAQQHHTSPVPALCAPACMRALHGEHAGTRATPCAPHARASRSQRS